jgi:hypothetical protein
MRDFREYTREARSLEDPINGSDGFEKISPPIAAIPEKSIAGGTAAKNE